MGAASSVSDVPQGIRSLRGQGRFRIGDMIDLEPAISADGPRLVALREEAARWLTDRGITQWTPGEIGIAEVAAQVVASEWFVLRREGRVIAAMRLLSSDEPVWGPQSDEAVYLHGLVVDRSEAGRSLGAALLTWAEQRSRDTGRTLLRLDCVESNMPLRDYYARAGFTEVGRREFTHRSWHPVVLLEKRLASHDEGNPTVSP